MPDAYCPLGLWDRQWTIVLTNPMRQTVRAAYELSSCLIIGVVPNWYIGKSILSPPRYHNRYSDQLRWLQKTIDEPSVTENFLWVEDELPKLPFNDLRIPRYTHSPINPQNEVLLLERGHTTINYETCWPCVFNKGRLQEVLDTYRPPFHAPTIYFNHYNIEGQQENSPPRNSLAYCPLEAF
jgi:hypothetical protein